MSRLVHTEFPLPRTLGRVPEAEWRVLFIEEHIQNSPSLARWDDAGLLLIHACGLLWLTRFGSRGLAHEVWPTIVIR